MDAIYQKVSKCKLCLYCAFFFFLTGDGHYF